MKKPSTFDALPPVSFSHTWKSCVFHVILQQTVSETGDEQVLSQIEEQDDASLMRPIKTNN